MKDSVYLAAVLLPLISAVIGSAGESSVKERPNVIVLITDDQGYGDLSCHGNPVLKTPHLDRLHHESVRLTDFHVAPMCTPTRGQLMTGVDALRNGAMNVSSGRTLLRREFPTMGDIFAKSGYATGLFGKWHLGDNYPYRPQDRGFQESIWYPSSHIGSVPDAWENDYFDDIYYHNGRPRQFRGYTTDVFFGEAIRWMQEQAKAGRPFFCYLATAAPHSPHFVPERYRDPLRKALDAARPQLSNFLPQSQRGANATFEDQLTRFLGMIANIDENVGRLEEFLTRSGLRQNTLLIFLTDNGSTFGPRYFNAGMKGGKTTLWEGGHRVPCFVRWPGGNLRPPGDVPGLTQVQDLLPTLVDLLQLDVPPDTRFDGISLAPALRGAASVPEDRMVVINYSRMPLKNVRPTPDSGAVPTREGAAVLWKRWRLLEDKALYNLDEDPLQEHNVIDQYPEVVAQMRSHLNTWWEGVKPRINEFQPVVVGDEAENPTRLTACEWADVFLDQQAQVRRGEKKSGVWHIEVAQSGQYAFEMSRWPFASGLRLSEGIAQTQVTDGVLTAGDPWPAANARIRIGETERLVPVSRDAIAARCVVSLKAGRTTLETMFLDDNGQEIAGAYYVTVERLRQVEHPAKLILDTDMSGDCDDAGALAILHAMADHGECEILATIVNRKDRTNASAAAVDAINTYYGRGNLPIGTDKIGPTDLQRTSAYAPGLRDGFPNDIGPDDRAPDALDVYRQVLGSQPDGTVTICSVGALSNLAELCRREPELVRKKVQRLVIMGGEFPVSKTPETNIRTHREAARIVAEQWPGEIIWVGFEVGNIVFTGEGLKLTPRENPVRRAYELRPFRGRPAIDGSQPSWDQTAALIAVRGLEPYLWDVVKGGQVEIDSEGQTRWQSNGNGKHGYVRLACPPEKVAAVIENLMMAPPVARMANAKQP